MSDPHSAGPRRSSKEKTARSLYQAWLRESATRYIDYVIDIDIDDGLHRLHHQHFFRNFGVGNVFYLDLQIFVFTCIFISIDLGMLRSMLSKKYKFPLRNPIVVSERSMRRYMI